MRKKTYTKDDLMTLFEEFLDKHLDNEIEDPAPDMEDKAMASKHREYYTIVNENGDTELVRLYGKNKADTDLKFQTLCSDRAKNHISDNSKWKQNLTFKSFVEEQYRPNHMVPPFIAETTQGKYEYALRRYIYPEFGEKRMDILKATRKRCGKAVIILWAPGLSGCGIKPYGIFRERSDEGLSLF